MKQNIMICMETPVRHFLFIPVTLHVYANPVVFERSIAF